MSAKQRGTDTNWALNRHGVTLTELCVVFGVMGLLIAVLLPGVQRAREASRRVHCQSNLRQIGIALNNYQSSCGVYPAGSGYAMMVAPGFGVARLFSPSAYILPYLGQESLYASVNFQLRTLDPASDGPENTTAFHRPLELFLCPSDASPSGGPGGKNNYRYSVGSNQGLGSRANGSFPPTLWTAPKDYADGMAFTTGGSEKIKGDGDPGRYTPFGDIWSAGLLNPSIEQLVTLCNAAPVLPPHYSNSGASWFHGSFAHTWYNHVLSPNHRIPDCQTGNVNAGPGLFTARSMHPGGVNVLMMDGAVRFLTNDIDLAVWHAIATRSGGEQTGSAF